MAGSYQHCLTDDGTYRGTDLLENMGDMAEAVEQMFFMICVLSRLDPLLLQQARGAYYRVVRGEAPIPDFMRPGMDPR